ncbi:MAG: hypothetical protein ACYC8T_03020 [Myxococcaceae bacterium]
MTTHRRLAGLLAPALLLAAACGGPPLGSKEDAARAMAQASIPSVGAKGALLSVLGQGALPEPSFTVPGPEGGEATVSINAVGAIIGFAAKGVLFDVEFTGFAAGDNRLDGRLSVIANFEYQAAGGEEPSADLKLSLVGRVTLSGVYSDELHVNLTLITRFADLSSRGEGITLRLNGKIDAREGTFSFTEEDLQVLWKKLTR